MLRGDIVEDDGGCKVVFAGHGASASQMSAAAVSRQNITSARNGERSERCIFGVHTVLIKERSQSLKVLATDAPRFGVRLLRNRHPAQWHTVNDSVGPLEGNVFGLPLAGFL